MDKDEKKALLAVIHSQTRQIDWLCGELAIRFCPRCPPDMLGPERHKPCRWMPKGLGWVGWDYAHWSDCTGYPGATTGKRWLLEEVVEVELKDAVARLDLGAGYPARGIAGRVVSPEEWIYGR